MPRLGKRKRDEARFGKPERLADQLLNRSLEHGIQAFAKDPRWRLHLPDLMDEYLKNLETCVVVDGSNVADYYYSYCEKSTWDVTTDFPSCKPPFPAMFIEFRRPKIFLNEEGFQEFDESFHQRWGWIIETLSARSLGREPISPDFDSQIAPLADLPDVESILRMTLATVQRGLVVVGTITYFAAIDRNGSIIGNHKYSLLALAGDDIKEAHKVGSDSGQLAHTAYLTISFMNCKNVSINALEPNPRMNADRIKAGRKPFVRYHTINIEPMKTVLRTEGGIETNGLKKALHICRGHFATYTEEHPLFGHFVGTVWKQAHVRGSAKSGVVVKDYNVNAPKTEGDA